MRLFLGSAESFLPSQTRIYAAVDGKLLDLHPAYAAYLIEVRNQQATAYDCAAYFFPPTISGFLERGEPARKALDEVVDFARSRGVRDLRGPAGEKLAYDSGEVRLLPPLPNPEKSLVIGFSDRAREEGLPQAEIPTAFYKLPFTFVTHGTPITWPAFANELDADGCLAIVIGKSGRRIPPERAWDYVAGLSLFVDITARDVNRREGRTTNNLLGKNFPGGACSGPGVLLEASRRVLEKMAVEVSLDGAVKQNFSLEECVFTVEQVISRYSILGLKPGDFLAIGASMSARGGRLRNPVPLKIGSTLRCTAPAIGELVHPVLAKRGTRP